MTKINLQVQRHFKTDILLKVPDAESERFFKYQWFNCHVQLISMEWDSLIILPESKVVINIEVKSGSTFTPLNSAAKQTNKHLSIFRNIFGSFCSDEWKFMKSAYIPNLNLEEVKEPCGFCKQYIITKANMEIRIKELTKSYMLYPAENFKKEYENLLVGIIGFSSIRQSDELNKLIVNPYEFSRETERKITGQTNAIQGENEEYKPRLKDVSYIDKEEKGKKSKGKTIQSEYLCYMLTADQFLAVKDPSSNIIIE